MSFDFYRLDNLGKHPSHDPERYFRAAAGAYGFIYKTMAAVGVLDQNMLIPSWESVDEHARALRSPESRIVPAFKLGLNSAFIVTPEECEIIAGALLPAISETREKLDLSPAEVRALDFLEQFARFNRGATPYGGYEVR